jgi:hypothetical protein
MLQPALPPPTKEVLERRVYAAKPGLMERGIEAPILHQEAEARRAAAEELYIKGPKTLAEGALTEQRLLETKLLKKYGEDEKESAIGLNKAKAYHYRVTAGAEAKKVSLLEAAKSEEQYEKFLTQNFTDIRELHQKRQDTFMTRPYISPKEKHEAVLDTARRTSNFLKAARPNDYRALLLSEYVVPDLYKRFKELTAEPSYGREQVTQTVELVGALEIIGAAARISNSIVLDPRTKALVTEMVGWAKANQKAVEGVVEGGRK